MIIGTLMSSHYWSISKAQIIKESTNHLHIEISSSHEPNTILSLEKQGINFQELKQKSAVAIQRDFHTLSIRKLGQF